MTWDLHALGPAFGATCIVVLGGCHVHARSFRQIIKNHVSEDTLISFGTLAALLRSFVLLARGTANAGFVIPAVGMAAYLVSRFLVDRIWRRRFAPGMEIFMAIQRQRRSPGVLFHSPLLRLLDRLNSGGFFVTIVMALAVAAAGTQFYLSDNPDFAFNVFISVILVASPWVLALAVPSALLAGLKAAAFRGVLFRDFEMFESPSPKRVLIKNVDESALENQSKEIVARLRESGLEVICGDHMRHPMPGESPRILELERKSDGGALVSRLVNLPRGFSDLPLALVCAWLIGRSVRFQMVWAVLYNGAALILALLGFLSPLWVVPLMCAGVFVIVANSVILSQRLKNVEA